MCPSAQTASARRGFLDASRSDAAYSFARAFDGSYRPPGTFRLVLTVCGGGARVMGTPFFMGPRAKQ
jgi:hypothetical protein